MLKQCSNMISIEAPSSICTLRTKYPSTPASTTRASSERSRAKTAYPEQLVTIGTGLSVKGSNQLKSLLKRNTDIFAWEPSDMTDVPKRIIKHSLSVNPLEGPVSQKRMVFCPKKIRAITKEVDEWLRVQMAEEDEEKMAFYLRCLI
nr:reverse transcriptase domain-containing protein [Tanacetum cinerariifolium]